MVNYTNKKYDEKKGKTPPINFIPAQEPDAITGHWPGWVPIGNTPTDKWSREAFDPSLPDGTYELCGPKVQSNHEKFLKHILIPHGKDVIPDAPRTYEKLKEWFKGKDIEGIVWHSSDDKMVKIKKEDFGLKRQE